MSMRCHYRLSTKQRLGFCIASFSGMSMRLDFGERTCQMFLLGIAGVIVVMHASLFDCADKVAALLNIAVLFVDVGLLPAGSIMDVRLNFRQRTNQISVYIKAIRIMCM